MATRVSATAAARGFSDLLNRVRYRDERFVIERGGEPVAELGPPTRGPVTLADLAALLARLPPADPTWARDLEEIQAGQGLLPEDPWASS